jgi:hypothetical protein
MGIRGELFSEKVLSSSEKRTYFFNVKENRNGDIFLNIVESKQHSGTDNERYQIAVFKEDLALFMRGLEKTLDFMRSAGTKRKTFGEFQKDRGGPKEGGEAR